MNLKEKLAKEAAEKVKSVKMPKTEAPKEAPVKNTKGHSLDEIAHDPESARILDTMYMVNGVRQKQGHKGLTDKDKRMFEKAFAGIKTATLTTDISEVIPSGFTGRLWQDIIAEMSVGDIIPTLSIPSPGFTDTIEVHGVTAYMTSENDTASDTNDNYLDMIYLVKKAMAKTYLTYEAADDASIDMLLRKRASLTKALAQSWERAIISGDNSTTHMDFGIGATDYRNAFKGLRKLGLSKSSTDFGGTAMTDAVFQQFLLNMQNAGGEYLDQNEVDAGNVALVVPQNLYQRIRVMDGFTDASKSGIGSTLTGGRSVSDIWGIPLVVSKYMPSSVQADGTVGAGISGSENSFSSCIMFNKNYVQGYYTGEVRAGFDENVEYERYVMTSSARYGFNSIFDRLEATPDAIDTTRKNIVTGININLTRSV
jgi:HK97 family phage major capsid protein